MRGNKISISDLVRDIEDGEVKVIEGRLLGAMETLWVDPKLGTFTYYNYEYLDEDGNMKEDYLELPTHTGVVYSKAKVGDKIFIYRGKKVIGVEIRGRFLNRLKHSSVILCKE